MIPYLIGIIGKSDVFKIYEALQEDDNLSLLPEVAYYYLSHLNKTLYTNRLLYNDIHFHKPIMGELSYYAEFVDVGIEKYIKLCGKDDYQHPLKLVRNKDGVLTYLDIDATYKVSYPDIFSSDIKKFYRAAKLCIEHYIDDGVQVLFRTLLSIPQLAYNKPVLMKYKDALVEEWVRVYKATPNFDEYDWYSQLIVILAICRDIMAVEDYCMLEMMKYDEQ